MVATLLRHSRDWSAGGNVHLEGGHAHMIIDSVDFYYAAMPNITLDADGSQDALIVRVRAGAHEGWGECEASPLTSIAAFVTPLSHGVCQPVSASVIGQRIDTADDIARIARLVARNSMDLLQAGHTWSGIEIALWDLLGRMRDEPVWKLLGYARSHPKLPYASMLMGETPQETLESAVSAVDAGFRAVKMGWGPYGMGSVKTDADHVVAAREGLGSEGTLLIDAGQIWVDDVDSAAERIAALEAARVTWLEEPFEPHAFAAHAALAARTSTLGIAAGEAAHSVQMAKNLVDYGQIRFVQVDAARIGGIGAAKAVADHAVANGATFVNHTFTSHLALSASIQPFAGLADHRICEYPLEPREVARVLSRNHLHLDDNGEIRAPDAPGLGIDVDLEALTPFLRSVAISIDGVSIYGSPDPTTTVRTPA